MICLSVSYAIEMLEYFWIIWIILSSSQNELMDLYCQSLTTMILVMDYIQVGGIFGKNSGFEVESLTWILIIDYQTIKSIGDCIEGLFAFYSL